MYFRKKTQDNSTLKRPRLKPELTNVEENGCSAKTKKAKLHSLAQQAFAKSPKSDTVRKIPPNKDLSNHKQRETLTNGIYTNGQYMRNLNTSTLAATASSNIFNRYPFFPTYLSLPTVETPLSYLDDSQRISFSSYLRCKKESNSIGGGDRSGGDKIFQENIAQSNNVISYVDLTVSEYLILLFCISMHSVCVFTGGRAEWSGTSCIWTYHSGTYVTKWMRIIIRKYYLKVDHFLQWLVD